jgi:hypothetical protein
LRPHVGQKRGVGKDLHLVSNTDAKVIAVKTEYVGVVGFDAADLKHGVSLLRMRAASSNASRHLLQTQPRCHRRNRTLDAS